MQTLELPDRVDAASHRVRLLRPPVRLEPIDVALYALPERSRIPVQRWLVEFLIQTLRTPPGSPRSSR